MLNENAVSPVTRPNTTCVVNVYPHGTITDFGSLETLTGVRHTPPKTLRSKVRTFSRASAARLRQLLATAKGPDDWFCFGVTLTVPGPPISTGEWRRLWRAYNQRLRRIGNVLMVWRIELQVRGQPHVHCICWGTHTEGEFNGRWANSLQCVLKQHWLDTLGILGGCSGPARTKLEGQFFTDDGEEVEFERGHASVSHRRYWPGAKKHAVKFDGLGAGDRIGWWRYLAAHASKSKQAQLGWQGRQWGVVNRSRLDHEEPISIELPRRAMYRVIRCLRRLTGCRFASGHGKQTWFNLPATSQRLCDWAKAELAEIAHLEGATSITAMT